MDQHDRITVGGGLLGYRRKHNSFLRFCEQPPRKPTTHLLLLLNYLFCNKIFWTQIVIRSGPVILPRFQDPLMASMRYLVKNTASNRYWISLNQRTRGWAKSGNYSGGSSASGKTNVVDLIIRALEEYTKQVSVRLYTFFFRFENEDGSRCVKFTLLFTIIPAALPNFDAKADGNLAVPGKNFSIISISNKANKHCWFQFYQIPILIKRLSIFSKNSSVIKMKG